MSWLKISSVELEVELRKNSYLICNVKNKINANYTANDNSRRYFDLFKITPI